MNTGLVKINWKESDGYSQEEITYFLFLEGKPIEVLCKIRNLHREEIQKHIIEGKIKYRHLAKSTDGESLFKSISKAGKDDKIAVLNALDDENSNKLFEYIENTYAEMGPIEKEAAVWMIGEKREKKYLSILVKASVNKIVNIRRMAISAMGKIGDKSAEIPLLRALDDSNPQVVSYAIKALYKIESRAAIEKINKVKDTTTIEYLKRGAEEFLNAMEDMK